MEWVGYIRKEKKKEGEGYDYKNSERKKEGEKEEKTKSRKGMRMIQAEYQIFLWWNSKTGLPKSRLFLIP